MNAEEDIGAYAWTMSCTAKERAAEEWLMLAKAFMESSSLEEYKIKKDLLLPSDSIWNDTMNEGLHNERML